ncbi:probable serine carboxypeptidase CPVL [Ornithodoros turicata]|uniref:probable serine carboxypeptidase CPVL n=1 Tax=Ornithodoros turicata TaxID=34597 RepID=UPI003139DB5A
MKCLLVICCLLCGAQAWLGGLRMMYRPKTLPVDERGPPVGDALFLTPYIRQGRLEEARNLSRVGPIGTDPELESYSGFFTVKELYHNNLFFWFFPAKEEPSTAPVILWLQGGPGGSSLFGLFVEHGPYRVTAAGNAQLRNLTWARQFSMLYVDNPVGAGFSFTEDDAGYARNQTDVANDLYEALQQFFTLFPEYKKNDFYASGESYAGKYVPAIAYKIHTEGIKESGINLRGIAIGDGMCDPETMFDYADFLYQVGLVDRNQASFIRRESERARDLIRQKRFMEAFYIFDKLLNGDETNSSSYFQNVTGLNFYYNFLLAQSPPEFDFYHTFVQAPRIRKSIHVGDLPFNDGSKCEAHLLDDMMRSVKPWVGTLMDHYKVLIYNGQLDIIIAYPLTENFVSTISWHGAHEYAHAPRKIWRLPSKENDVAGYVKRVGKFFQVLVRNSGHILPYDQPESAFDLITRFVRDLPFDE